MKAISVDNAWGAILDEEKNVLLPKVFASPEIAQQFLDAAERSGVSLYVGMPLSDMQSLFGLWYDAWKRETGQPPVIAN